LKKKKCAYCEKTFNKKRDVNFWTMPLTTMVDSEPVCDSCAIRISPNAAIQIAGIIGVGE
jgi:hypothetical protein